MSAMPDNYVCSLGKAAMSTAKTKKEKIPQDLNLFEQLFAITTGKYAQSATDFLPADKKYNHASIISYQKANASKIAALTPVTEPVYADISRGRTISINFRKSLQWIVTSPVARAAALLIFSGVIITFFNTVNDDSIRIVDESGQNAINNEFGNADKRVSLRVMRKRSKIGEFTVGEGSKLKVVRSSNGETFRSEVAFAGREADFKLKYKGKTSVIVNNGPFKARVRVAQNRNNDIHLRFKELGTPLPSGEPEFSIEVIKGHVQIAEIDDGDDFQPYNAGEKAIFSLTPNDSENL
jgi:hypothetical protein